MRIRFGIAHVLLLVAAASASTAALALPHEQITVTLRVYVLHAEGPAQGGDAPTDAELMLACARANRDFKPARVSFRCVVGRVATRSNVVAPGSAEEREVRAAFPARPGALTAYVVRAAPHREGTVRVRLDGWVNYGAEQDSLFIDAGALSALTHELGHTLGLRDRQPVRRVRGACAAENFMQNMDLGCARGFEPWQLQVVRGRALRFARPSGHVSR